MGVGGAGRGGEGLKLLVGPWAPVVWGGCAGPDPGRERGSVMSSGHSFCAGE